MRLPTWILITGAVLFGCASDSSSSGTLGGESVTERKVTPMEESTPDTANEMPAGKTAVLETNLGTIKIAFFEDKAPGHVKNFTDLAKKGFYDGTRFHRVIPGFMIQGGDPLSKSGNRNVMGTGDPGYKIKAEFNDTKHVRGIVSMARAGDPDSAGSQFFICVDDAGFLDGKYTAFGKVIEGMDVVDKIVNLKRDPRDNPLEENPAIMKKVSVVEKK
jgi:peptidyl-prolyl cis-trans isomerase B (cyclophilin B)